MKCFPNFALGEVLECWKVQDILKMQHGAVHKKTLMVLSLILICSTEC